MGTKDINDIPPPLEGLGLWDEEHPNRIYTNALLRERMAAGPNPICGVFGCTEPTYTGKADNPFHFCPWHRHAIVTSFIKSRKLCYRALVKYGLRKEARLFCQAAGPKRVTGRRIVRMVTLSCAKCSRSFQRPAYVVRKSRKKGDRRAFCPTCWQATSHASVTLACAKCGREFQRRACDMRKSQRHGFHRSFCLECWPTSRGSSVILTCAKCGQPFQRRAVDDRLARQRNFKRAYCHGCSNSRKPLFWAESVTLSCTSCGRTFRRSRAHATYGVKLGVRQQYCSWPCFQQSRRGRKEGE